MKVIFNAAQIAARVRGLGARIAADYERSDDLVLLVVLSGAFVFAADLARQIERPFRVEFVKARSYGDATESSGEVRVSGSFDVRSADVLLIEDIVDTGRTVAVLRESLLREHGARSVRVCALLHKPARAVVPGAPEYVGFTAPDAFVIGYGMDDAGLARGLPFVGVKGGIPA